MAAAPGLAEGRVAKMTIAAFQWSTAKVRLLYELYVLFMYGFQLSA